MWNPMRAIRNWWAKHLEARRWLETAIDEHEYGFLYSIDDEEVWKIFASAYVDPDAILRMRKAYEEGRTPEAAWEVAKRGST